MSTTKKTIQVYAKVSNMYTARGTVLVDFMNDSRRMVYDDGSANVAVTFTVYDDGRVYFFSPWNHRHETWVRVDTLSLQVDTSIDSICGEIREAEALLIRSGGYGITERSLTRRGFELYAESIPVRAGRRQVSECECMRPFSWSGTHVGLNYDPDCYDHGLPAAWR